MDEEEARQKKLEELKEEYAEKQKEENVELQLNQLARSLLTEEAKVRLSNVKLVNRELYMKALQSLIYLNRSGKVTGKISEGQLKQVLESLRNKREITIKRK